MKKKIKNKGPDNRSDAVGEEVEPVTGAIGNEVFLHYFSESAIGNADDYGK